MPVSPFAPSTSENYLWLAAWTSMYNISILAVFFASLPVLCFYSTRATSFSDCFMPSWCVACDCFPAFHSLTFALVCPYGVSYACPACRLHMLHHFTLGDLPKCVRENETKVVAFNQKWVYRQKILDSQNQRVETDLRSLLVSFLNSWQDCRKPVLEYHYHLLTYDYIKQF